MHVSFYFSAQELVGLWEGKLKSKLLIYHGDTEDTGMHGEP